MYTLSLNSCHWGFSKHLTNMALGGTKPVTCLILLHGAFSKARIIFLLNDVNSVTNINILCKSFLCLVAGSLLRLKSILKVLHILDSGR